MIELQLIKPLSEREQRAIENHKIARQAIVRHNAAKIQHEDASRQQTASGKRCDTQPLTVPAGCAAIISAASQEPHRIAVTAEPLSVSDGVTYCGKRGMSTRARMAKLGI